MKRWIIAAVVLIAIISTAAVVYTRRNKAELQVQTAPLSRGDIVDIDEVAAFEPVLGSLNCSAPTSTAS